MPQIPFRHSTNACIGLSVPPRLRHVGPQARAARRDLCDAQATGRARTERWHGRERVLQRRRRQRIGGCRASDFLIVAIEQEGFRSFYAALSDPAM